LKLYFSSSSSSHCMPHFLCCYLQQGTRFFASPVSMRLRPKRICSGVVCIGAYHINRL
ncbi:hypothetical protein M569_09940, partial [Genlisea aurea]